MTLENRPWHWQSLKVEEEGDNWGWDGWMADPTWWTWVWASSGNWWWTGKPVVLHSIGSQTVMTVWLNCTEWWKNMFQSKVSCCISLREHELHFIPETFLFNIYDSLLIIKKSNLIFSLNSFIHGWFFFLAYCILLKFKKQMYYHITILKKVFSFKYCDLWDRDKLD